MNQRTHLGTTYLDIAKGAVETFMKVPALPGERRRERARGEGAVGGCGPGARGAAGETGGGTGGWAAPRRGGSGASSRLTLRFVPAPQLRARDPASRGDRYMLVTFEEPPYAIKVTPLPPPSPPPPGPPSCPAAPPPRSGRAARRRARTGSGSGGGGADINMADIFFFFYIPRVVCVSGTELWGRCA